MEEAKPQDLAAMQAGLAASIDELRAALSGAALADWAKTAASAKAKEATLDSSGKPKVWVLIAASVALALVVMGLTVRLAGRKGKAK